MPEPHATHWLRFVESMLGLLGSASLQGAACLSSGAVLAALGVLLGRSLYDLTLLFFLGMAVPLWPLRVYFSPGKIVRRRFTLWDSWVRQGIISEAQCKRWKRELLAWYGKAILETGFERGERTSALSIAEDAAEAR